MNFFNIEYASPADLNDTLTVRFRLLDNAVVPLWRDAVTEALANCQLDDPKRFYGFNSPEQEVANALSQINKCIDVINTHQVIIDRHLTDINDQDTLNYLHHIFEVYHGLHGKQTHRFYLTANKTVREAIGNLNICVHRCENAARQHPPMHICTWFGLPLTRTLRDEDYQLFTMHHKFGTVLLNYSEVGKTIENLTEDNDQYIDSSAFKPFKHFGPDFRVIFWDTDPVQVNEFSVKIQEYYNSRQDFFGPWQPCYAPGSVPVAVIDGTVDLKELSTRQYIKSVSFN